MIAALQRLVRVLTFAVIVILALLLSFILTAEAAQNSDRSVLQKGLLLMQSEKFEDAALAWQADADVLAKSDQEDAQQQAGMRYVLATIAFDKSEDARAYGTWAKAIELYLRSGSDWLTERDNIKSNIEKSRAALVGLLNGEVASLKTNTADLSLVNIDAFVGLTKFDGPRRNLKSLDEPKEEDIKSSRSYIARPLALQSSETLAEPVQMAADYDDINTKDNKPISLAQNSDGFAPRIGNSVTPIDDEQEIKKLRRAFAAVVHREGIKKEPETNRKDIRKEDGKSKQAVDASNNRAAEELNIRHVVPQLPQLKGTISKPEDLTVESLPQRGYPGIH